MILILAYHTQTVRLIVSSNVAMKGTLTMQQPIMTLSTTISSSVAHLIQALNYHLDDKGSNSTRHKEFQPFDNSHI